MPIPTDNNAIIMNELRSERSFKLFAVYIVRV